MLFRKIFCLGLFLLATFALNAQNDATKLIVFEGSDWCRNCIRFEKKVLNSPLFISFSNQNKLKIEHIDFPQRKKLDPKTIAHNNAVAEKYHFNGTFPTILLVHTSTVHEISYKNESDKEFIALLKTKMPASE